MVAQADQRHDRPAQPLHARPRALLGSARRLEQRLEQAAPRARASPRAPARSPPASARPGVAAAPGAAQRVQDPPGARRADPVEQLQHAKPGQLVGRVVHQAQQREQVLDVGGVEIAQPPVLDERDPPAGQLELQQGRVVAGAEQDRLGAQLDPLLARGQHPLAHLPRLLALVVGEHELGRRAALAVAPQAPRNAPRSCAETPLATSRIACVER